MTYNALTGGFAPSAPSTAAPLAREWRWHDGALGLVHYWAFEFTVGARH